MEAKKKSEEKEKHMGREEKENLWEKTVVQVCIFILQFKKIVILYLEIWVVLGDRKKDDFF